MRNMRKYDEFCSKIHHIISLDQFFTNWFKMKTHCKFASHHNIAIQFNDFSVSKCKVNYFCLSLITWKIPFFHGKTRYSNVMSTVADPVFPRQGVPTPEFGPNSYHLARFLPKTASKWKKLDRGGTRSWHPLPTRIRQWSKQWSI